MTNITESYQSPSGSSLTNPQVAEPTTSVFGQAKLTNVPSCQQPEITPPAPQQSQTRTVTFDSESQIATAQQSKSQETTDDIDLSVDNFTAVVAELSPVPDASNRRANARRRKAEKVKYTQVRHTKRC